jgi:hypothetical protein
MPNPLVAKRVDSTKLDSGIFLLEDLDTIEEGINSGSWIETGLGGVAATLDALNTIANPLETVAAWGVAWLIEHFEPFSAVLEALAGDADQVAAFAQTWENVSKAIKTTGENLRTAIDRETIDWTGSAAEAYRAHMNEQLTALLTLVKVAAVLSIAVKAAGLLVAFVRQLVRDITAQAIAAVAVELPVLLAEEGLTAGLATPVVIAQIVALLAEFIARIEHDVTNLVKSLRNLIRLLRRLDEILPAIVQLIKRLARESPHGGPRPGRVEVPRVRRGPLLTTEEIDRIVQALEEADTPQPGHPPPGGHGPRAIHGEQGMGFHYSQEKGWAFLVGPSGTGAGGHPWNAGGPDGFAFRTEGDFELHILDNKSVQDATVSKASALTTTLEDNVHKKLAQAMDPAMNDVPRINEVRKALQDTETALHNGTPLPPEVHLVVTNEGGRATGISGSLASQGVEFRDIQTPPQVPPPAPQPPSGPRPRVAPPPPQDGDR